MAYRRKTCNYAQCNLDQEERELLTSFEKDEWKTVESTAKEKKRAQKAATQTLRKK